MPLITQRVIHNGNVKIPAKEDEMRAAQYYRGEMLLASAWVEMWGGKDDPMVRKCMERLLLAQGHIGSAQMLDVIAAASGRVKGADSRDASDTLKQVQDLATKTWSGDIRFITAVLALVNYPQHVIERKSFGDICHANLRKWAISVGAPSYI